MDKNQQWEIVQVSKDQYDLLKKVLGGRAFFRQDGDNFYVRILTSIKNKIFNGQKNID